MMKSLFVRWFNDGKRLTALVLWVFGLAEPYIRSSGFPLPEGFLTQLAPELAGLLLVALSKAEVKIPQKP
jgi:hypothetical protein